MQETLYDKIGVDYNATRNADPFLVSRLLHFLKPVTGKTYLDIGCGTGNYTIALAEKGYRFYGVEPSEAMLNKAQKRNAKIEWLTGTAENIPFANNTFDGVMATLTIHHWKDLQRSFKEIFRVLNNKGRFVCFTSTAEQTNGYWLNHYFPKMLQNSSLQMPSIHVINDALIHAGFNVMATEKYFIKDDLQDQFLYVGKNRPHLYFNESIRNGISSFAALANNKEVERGLAELKKDIESNSFGRIKEQYENELGDYLFITAEKN
ncbi:MAG: methyltransferase domain-containing protein [Ferruginibacter sp.]